MKIHHLYSKSNVDVENQVGFFSESILYELFKFNLYQFLRAARCSMHILNASKRVIISERGFSVGVNGR